MIARARRESFVQPNPSRPAADENTLPRVPDQQRTRPALRVGAGVQDSGVMQPRFVARPNCADASAALLAEAPPALLLVEGSAVGTLLDILERLATSVAEPPTIGSSQEP